MADGRGSVAPSFSQDAVHSFVQTALRGVPCPTKTTGILSVDGISCDSFMHAARVPKAAVLNAPIKKRLRP